MQQFFANLPFWASPWHFAQRETPGRVAGPRGRFILAQVVIALCIGLLLGKIGAFGTYRELAVLDRYVYWLAITLIDWSLIVATARALRAVFAAFAALPLVIQVMLTVIIAALPGTLAVCGLDSLLRVVPQWDWLPLLYINTAVMAFAIALPVALALRPAATPAAEPQQMPPPARMPSFLNRIPPALGRELLALEMEDHYLRIHTAKGSALILLRLRDALAELEGVDGLQVHRSWWVARAALDAVAREAGKPVLKLKNGLSVPVSRSYREAVKMAGWI